MPAGDIPDFMLIIAADGSAHVSVVAPNVSMGDEPNSVFSNGGTSIVIHAIAAPGSSGSPARIARARSSKKQNSFTQRHNGILTRSLLWRGRDLFSSCILSAGLW